MDNPVQPLPRGGIRKDQLPQAIAVDSAVRAGDRRPQPVSDLSPGLFSGKNDLPSNAIGIKAEGAPFSSSMQGDGALSGGDPLRSNR